MSKTWIGVLVAVGVSAMLAVVGGVAFLIFSVAMQSKSEFEKELLTPSANLDAETSAFPSTDVETEPAGLPERYTRKLPDRAQEVIDRREELPPASHYGARLCRGDTATRDELLERITTASGAGATKEELTTAYAPFLRGCDNRPHCDWLREEALSGDQPDPVKHVVREALIACGRLEDGPVFERAEAASQVVRWYSDVVSLGGDAPFELTALERGIRATFAEPSPDSARALTQVAIRIGRSRTPAAKAALLRLHGLARLAEHKNALAYGLGAYPEDRRASALFEAACVSGEYPCEWARGMLGQPSEKPLGFREQVRSGRLEVARFVATNPQRLKELQDEWATCAEEELVKRKDGGEAPSAEGLGCLQWLSSFDDARAAGIAERVPPADTDGYEDIEELQMRTPLAELEADLRQRRLIPNAPTPRVIVEDHDRIGRPVLTAEDVIVAHGKTITFDVETGRFPNEHDELLRKLAPLAGGGLDDAIFEEEPPTEEQAEKNEGEYVLRAYLDGKRYTAHAQNLGDWYDLEAVLGLLNHLLEQRNAKERCATFLTFDQMVTVVCADREALEKADDDYLIALGDADAAESAGKLAEEHVPDEVE